MGDIDLKNADSRAKYLKDNLGHLMNGIDSNYGQVLMDELMRRMEATVSEFNEEVKAMLGQLQGIKPIPKDNILASAPRPEPQAPPVPKAAPPVEEPEPAPEIPQFNADLDEPDAPAAPLKEVEIEVDLDDDALSDFEKKLRSLTR